jgi:glycosyltransferase involved in cell wall biosynthesis
MAVFRPIDLRRYAFSMKIIEYMAAGLPVITTAGTESESVVKKHQCGEAVRFDEADLAACLSSLLGDPEKMARYSDNAMKASRLYSWDDLILNRYYGLIKQCYS